MKEFLDSKAGRTLIIALIATGTTIFAVPWDGAETVLRAGGGAFFGALAPLVFYLMKSEGEAGEVTPVGWNMTAKVSSPITDFDSDYHFTDDGRHLGKSVDCKLCHP